MAESSSSSASSESSESISAGTRRLVVTVETTPKYRVTRDTGIRTRIEVTDSDGMTKHVFRYLALPVTADNPAAVRYDGVCSPADIEDFPIGDPDGETTPAFCRRNVVDLVFRSSAEAEHMRTVIREALQTLVDTLNRLDTLEASDSWEIT